MREVMLTTFDNEFDPFTNYNAWYTEDVRLGHNCNGLLATFAFPSNALSDSLNYEEIEQAIDEIIVNDNLNIYKKVVREIEEKVVT